MPGLPAIDRKLLRDLWHLRGQALAIALVIGSGIATFVMSLATWESLVRTRDGFYATHRFADAFGDCKRAPEAVAKRLAAIPGVQLVQTSVFAPITAEVDGFDEPIAGMLRSLPAHGRPALNRIHLRTGRMAEPGRDDEVVLGEAFAEAHKLEPGARFTVVVNGRRKHLRVVGTGLAPDTVFQLSPTSLFPDFKRYVVAWMGRDALATAFDMEGAFNHVDLRLRGDAVPQTVLDRVDDELERYGGLGAHDRSEQISARYLTEEFRQLKQMATMFPIIFLGVAAFLLNIVVTRLVRTQREQIAALKAFGYTNTAVGWHYLKLVWVVVLVGTALGIAGGGWLAKALSEMYLQYYRFPYLTFVLPGTVAASATAISLAIGTLGTLVAVRQAVVLPPAEAMRPEPPPRYRRSWFERAGLLGWIDQPTRIVLRSLGRRPVKSAFAVLGVGFGTAVLMVSSFFGDTIDYVIAVQFGLVQHEDLVVQFTGPTSRRAAFELAEAPGVRRVEPFRVVPVRIRHGHRSHRTGIQGLQRDNRLHELRDASLRRHTVPDDGILLESYLAEMLGAHTGDVVTVEALEGQRPVRQVMVAGTIREFFGTSAYMSLDTLNRLMGEGHTISGAWCAVDADQLDPLISELGRRPGVAGSSATKVVLASFRDTMAEQMLTFAFFSTLLASTIAFAVVYNAARISLSEQARELASLRVLGFTRGEISYILLAQLAITVLCAIPVGWLLGSALCRAMVSAWQNELFRIPYVLDVSTYAFAGTAVLIAASISAFVVRGRLDRLDLVAVLKTRE
ncbi:MAG: ABC transporter permease [Planctomycetota bacterium]|jgi:putative ABC transport system permease protein